MTGQDVILGLLQRGPMSGYEIKQYFENIFTYFFDASYGAIYPALKKMENNCLIEKKVVIQEGKPNKNMYQITKEGDMKFKEYLYSPLEKDVVKSDFLMRLYFGSYAGDTQVVVWLEEMFEKTHAALEMLKKNYESYHTNMSSTQEMSIQIGMAQHELGLQMLNQFRQKYKKGE